jgi:hypothetical protein
MQRLTARLVPVIVLALALAPMLARAQQTFSKEQIDQLVAPIALYPDSLLSQVLMAATYPADVTDAAKWSKANPNQKGDAELHRQPRRSGLREGPRTEHRRDRARDDALQPGFELEQGRRAG